jgi:hypothetical protein
VSELGFTMRDGGCGALNRGGYGASTCGSGGAWGGRPRPDSSASPSLARA